MRARIAGKTADRTAVFEDWRRQVRKVLLAGGTTPFFLFSPQPILNRVSALEDLDFGIPASCFLSLKTQPLKALLAWWIHQGRPVEVVSEFEMRAALHESCPVERLLVNGPAKQRWLPQLSREGLRVNFDSLTEIRALLPIAKRDGWKVGLRVRTPEELDPENQGCPTQFGLCDKEVRQAVRLLRKHALEPSCVHTHIRTNLPDPSYWTRALSSIRDACAQAAWQPEIVDTGGGLPAFDTRNRGGGSLAASYDEALRSYAAHIKAALRQFTGCQQLWLEHGRHLTAGSGVLAIRILDLKPHDKGRSAICDGGRTLQALISMWESHDLLPLRRSTAPPIPVTVHGPTCMAFDQLGRFHLPGNLRAGDILIWLDSGAYHLPWETRFSHGLCQVWWQQGDSVLLARNAETFEDYWGRWNPLQEDPDVRDSLAASGNSP
jgi:diaminopimelate decarboxylase